MNLTYRGSALQILLLCCCSFLGTALSGYSPAALLDYVDWAKLPGADNLRVKDGFNMFAGYITVNEIHGRNIFYWFMESQDTPDDDPVILWTNGGPGSSGMIGCLTEHGPFQIRDGGETLVDNEYSWNKLANMLYVEVPSGVGFSYSAMEADYETGDDQTAVDNYDFIQGWLDRFPQYRSNDFHISSESYGGHYMPELAEVILSQNKQAAEVGSARVINFKGFLVGNPYTDAFSNQVAQYEALWGGQLLPKPMFEKWLEMCVFEGKEYKWSASCDNVEQKMDSIVDELNLYALDYPTCTDYKSRRFSSVGGDIDKAHTGAAAVSGSQGHALKRHVRRALYDAYGGGAHRMLGELHDSSYDPCAEDYLVTYMNRLDVQAALNVRLGTIWEESSTKVQYESDDLLRPMMSYYERLLEDDVKILVYSGDDDSVCATQGTQWWIYGLGYDVDSDWFWKPWNVDGQLAGYQTRFHNSSLAFVTVHSAGHEVPAYQPARAFQVLKRYLNGGWWNEPTVSVMSTS